MRVVLATWGQDLSRSAWESRFAASNSVTLSSWAAPPTLEFARANHQVPCPRSWHRGRERFLGQRIAPC